mmetsp:Transcript_28583/g.53585  ORF Transcript_28583/g.53585 Transcript_28583/m.53585 type:complete len:88 (+) Transcript_28583:270-533(+)
MGKKKTVSRYFCKICGCLVHQGPVSAPFRAVVPVTFKIEGLLPEKYQAKVHFNYENRLCNVADKLPKFKTFPPKNKMDNEGNLLESE